MRSIHGSGKSLFHFQFNPHSVNHAQPSVEQSKLQEVLACTNAESVQRLENRGLKLDPEDVSVIYAVEQAIANKEQVRIKLLFHFGASVPPDELNNLELCFLLLSQNATNEVRRMVTNGLSVDLDNALWLHFLVQQRTPIEIMLERMSRAGLTLKTEQVNTWANQLLDQAEFSPALGLLLVPMMFRVDPRLSTILAHSNRTALFTYLIENESIESTARLLCAGLQVDGNHVPLLQAMRIKCYAATQFGLLELLAQVGLLDTLPRYIIDDRNPKKIHGLDFLALVNLVKHNIVIPAELKNKNLFLAALLDRPPLNIEKSSTEYLTVLDKLIRAGTFTITGDSASTFKIGLMNSIINEYSFATDFLLKRDVKITLADLNQSAELTSRLKQAFKKNPTLALKSFDTQSFSSNPHNPIFQTLIRISFDKGDFERADSMCEQFKFPRKSMHEALIGFIDRKLRYPVWDGGPTFEEMVVVADFEFQTRVLQAYLDEVMRLLNHNTNRQNLRDVSNAYYVGSKLRNFASLLKTVAVAQRDFYLIQIGNDLTEFARDFCAAQSPPEDLHNKTEKLMAIVRIYRSRAICVHELIGQLEPATA